MSQVLYRKYRPKKFGELVGQEYVIQSILGSFLLKKIPHAFLFTGPRGTGKTTIARLVAKLVNCETLIGTKFKKSDIIEPCNKCTFCSAVNENNCLDVVEIDAASNRGIDEIRNLKESVRFVPTLGQHKVYIIDEVHMLTKEAFNALLKTLEEPPPHVIFVLATTDPHKIPETILSRVQRFDFKTLGISPIVQKLKTIARKEKVNIEQNSLRMIALSANGGMRDAENNFAKVINFVGHTIKEKDIESVLDLISFDMMHNFYIHLAQKNRTEAIKHIHNLYEKGVDLNNFSHTFLDYLRRVLIVSLHPENIENYYKDYFTDAQKQQIIEQSKVIEPREITHALKLFMNAHEQIKTSPIIQLPLELAIVDFTT